MERTPPEPFVRLPAEMLPTLADRCADLGDEGIAALREAGRRAGNRIFDGLGVLPETLETEAFWSAADDVLRELGLGRITFEPVDGAVGAVSWRELPEATAGGAVAPRRSRGCALATGILGGLLTRAAGRPVAVLEIGCAAGGSDACWFLVGAEGRLREVHARLAEGGAVAAVLGR